MLTSVRTTLGSGLLLIAAVVASGCGGTQGDARAAGADQNGLEAFRACLEKEGVDLPAGGPGGGPGGPGGRPGGGQGGPPPGGGQGGPPPGGGQGGPRGGMPEQSRAAMEKCREELPAGGFGGPRGEVSEEQRTAFEKQRKQLEACLQEAGVNIERPAPGTGGPPQRGGTSPNAQLTEEQRGAFENCREKVGGNAGPPGGPGRPDGSPPPG